MARTSKYTCKLCNTTYEFCLKCSIAKPDFDAEHFCTHEHANIYAILSKHGCNLITADEALAALSAYNIDEIALTEDVAAHIARIKSETTVKVETPVVQTEVETPVVKTVTQSKKNNKKKW